MTNNDTQYVNAIAALLDRDRLKETPQGRATLALNALKRALSESAVKWTFDDAYHIALHLGQLNDAINELTTGDKV